MRQLRARRESCLTGDGLVLPAGMEDMEYNADSLQCALCAILDKEKAEVILDCLDTPSSQARFRRLKDLRDPSVSHDWLWKLSPAHGSVVPREDFQTAVRLRLGDP